MWITPEGQQVSFQEARRIATAAGVPLPKENDQQDSAAAVWLDAHGYQLVIVDEMALGWGSYEAAIFGALGLISLPTALASATTTIELSSSRSLRDPDCYADQKGARNMTS